MIILDYKDPFFYMGSNMIELLEGSDSEVYSN
jgi:hypothetical protein